MKRLICATTLSLLTVIGLMACGGSNDTLNVSGIGGTGVHNGTITGFGSVFVNGVEFSTTGTSFDVDDNSSALESDLRQGMVVTVTGTVNSNSTTGTATSIVYDDDLEGPISAMTTDPDMVTKTITVFGTNVIVDKGVTVFDDSAVAGFSFTTIAVNDLVEVSGYMDASVTPAVLNAMYIKKKGTLTLGVSEVEVKGTISGLGASSFMLGTLTINFDGATDISEVTGGMLIDGMFVEVKGALAMATTITASRIETEDEGYGDDVSNISIEGIVSDYVSNSSFKVNGQAVNASFATLEPSSLVISNGKRIEVEGAIASGILNAREVEGRSGKIEISARVAAGGVDNANGTITLTVISGQPTVLVNVTSRTRIYDDSSIDDPRLLLNEINDNDMLEIEALLGDAGEVIATEIKRTDNTKIELRGPVQFFSSVTPSVTILGIVVPSSAATDYEVNDVDLTQSQFYGALAAGVIVKIEDDEPNGVANEMEIES